MKTVIEFKVKNVYGNETMYVVSEHKAAIESLTKKKTIDSRDVANLMALGFAFKQI